MASAVDPRIAHLQNEIRAEIEGIIGRLNQLIIHPVSPSVGRLPAILVLQEDLNRACTNINFCTKQGFAWHHKNYGCTKTEMNAWKGLVSPTLEELKPKDSENRSAKFAAKNFNAELNDVKWPVQINGITWQDFFMTWQEHRDKFSSDWHRLVHLKSALSLQDKEQFGSATNPDSLVYSLMVRYGNETDFVLSKLRELKRLVKPDPSDNKMITSNLNIIFFE